jgi:ubiquinone/menaquinone biosynthesis C-methylase UbiE
MGFYRNYLLPRLTHLAMQHRGLAPYRNRIVAAANGRVLEIGIGSGLNLPFYRHATRIVGIEPSPKLLEMAREAGQQTPVPLELIEGSAEDLPIEDRSIDTIVMTWTLCSIPDPRRALGEMRRVLKPTGHLLFVEHGRAPEPRVQWWQDHLTPLWKHLSGGCHLNRPVGELIQNAAFHTEQLETGYMAGLKPMSFMYEGSARPR